MKTKTKESIQYRIEMLQYAVEGLKKSKEKEIEKVTGYIKNSAENPKYVSDWMDNWMKDIKLYEECMAQRYKEIEILQWVLSLEENKEG